MKRNETKTALTGDELSVLCWQLGQLCRAGMSWSDSAALLAEDAPTPRSRALLAGLRDALAAGVPLDRALAEAGEFPPYLLRMVSIGLAAGRAEQVLEALSGYYRRQSATGEALRRAVTYPAVKMCIRDRPPPGHSTGPPPAGWTAQPGRGIPGLPGSPKRP